ncbi:MAG: hypothetical protein WEB89_04830 [Balneolales bacterium]
MAKKSNPITVVTYSLLIAVNILLHMVLSGVNVAGLITQIFTEPTGIFSSIAFIVTWLFTTLFSTTGIYLIGLIIAFEFVLLPLMIRYKYVTVKANLTLSFVFALYLMLFARILAVVFG